MSAQNLPLPTKWVVRVMINLTACDTIFTRGSTQRLLDEMPFDSESEAMTQYWKLKNTYKFASLAGQYVTYPVRIDNYVAAEIPTKWCDYCGDGIPEANDAYTDMLGGDYCSKSCFNNRMHSSEDGGEHFDDVYEDDY